jgi:hypothetical protein
VFAFLAFLPRRSFWPSGACVAMPFIIGLPASVHRGESSDKGQWMLPLIGGPSATPFCLSPPWPANPICTPLGRLKWQSTPAGNDIARVGDAVECRD